MHNENGHYNIKIEKYDELETIVRGEICLMILNADVVNFKRDLSKILDDYAL